MHYRHNYGIANFVKPSSEYLPTQVKRNTCVRGLLLKIWRGISHVLPHCTPPNRLFPMNERNECFDSVCVRTLATKLQWPWVLPTTSLLQRQTPSLLIFEPLSTRMRLGMTGHWTVDTMDIHIIPTNAHANHTFARSFSPGYNITMHCVESSFKYLPHNVLMWTKATRAQKVLKIYLKINGKWVVTTT